LEKTDTATDCKDEKKDNLNRWLKVGHLKVEMGQVALASNWVQR
jgi:hypothetical protein